MSLQYGPPPVPDPELDGRSKVIDDLARLVGSATVVIEMLLDPADPARARGQAQDWLLSYARWCRLETR